MNRRVVLKDLLLIAGGITFLPACVNSSGKSSVALKNIDISAEQEKLLAEIASTIIPQTDTPGAKESGSHLFVLKMLDDCYEKGDQQKFVIGLDKLDRASKKRFGNSFVLCTRAEREAMLQSVEARGNSVESKPSPEAGKRNSEANQASSEEYKEKFDAEVFVFYKIMKERTLQGYLTSKYVVMEIMKYEMIPSVPYNGYYLIKNTKAHGRQS